MKRKNTFGVHFALRTQKADMEGKHPVYARITVNGTRCELAMKYRVLKSDWKIGKGEAKPKNPELRSFNNFLQQIHGKLRRHYWQLRLGDEPVTAALLKADFWGIEKDVPITRSLLWVVDRHHSMMENILKPGTMKNYHTTERYIKLFLEQCYKVTDMPLYDLNYEFISGLQSFIRSNALREKDPCTTNGTMKHLERLKKMVTWAVKNEWIAKDPFSNFRLKFKRTQRDFLSETELTSIERQNSKNPSLERVRNLFLFSCYTGLSYLDLMQLRPCEITTGADNMRWTKMTRAKTDTAVTVPLLKTAIAILEKFAQGEFHFSKTVFPSVSNQEINRNLKIVAEICGIQKDLTFHLARHTFATTVTLMNGVPIETISKMLGHTKITTTMIYAQVNHSKIRMEMDNLQEKLDGTQLDTTENK